MIKLLTLSALIFGACVPQPTNPGIATSPATGIKISVHKSEVTDIDMSSTDLPGDPCDLLSAQAPDRCGYILGCTNVDPGGGPKVGECIAWVCQGVGTVGECRRN